MDATFCFDLLSLNRYRYGLSENSYGWSFHLCAIDWNEYGWRSLFELEIVDRKLFSFSLFFVNLYFNGKRN